MDAATARQLRRYAATYEAPEFFADDRDPSTFIHGKGCSGGDASREATAFVASTLSFGSIKQFVPKIRSSGNIHR